MQKVSPRPDLAITAIGNRIFMSGIQGASFMSLCLPFSLCNSAISAHMENEFNLDARPKKNFFCCKSRSQSFWPNVTDTNVPDADEAFSNLFGANASC